MPLGKYQYQPLGTFLAELGQKNLLFCVHDGGKLISIEKVLNRFFFKEIKVAYY